MVRSCWGGGCTINTACYVLLATCHLLPATHPPLLTRHYSPATTHLLQAHSGLFTEAQSGAGYQRPLLVIMERTADLGVMMQAPAYRVHTVCMACAWRVHGVCMACAWRVHGVCMCMRMACAWHGMCMCMCLVCETSA